MKKEEILEASKKENKKMDEYELKVNLKGTSFAAISMLFLALIYYSYEIFTGKGTNPALYSVITIYNAVLFGYKAIKVERNRKLSIFTSVVWGLLTIMLVYSYFTGK